MSGSGRRFDGRSTVQFNIFVGTGSLERFFGLHRCGKAMELFLKTATRCNSDEFYYHLSAQQMCSGDDSYYHLSAQQMCYLVCAHHIQVIESSAYLGHNLIHCYVLWGVQDTWRLSNKVPT
jgi:hypothetical protein